MKPKFKSNSPTIERRIDMEIVVDAYNEYERSLGWFCYLENSLKFPFEAKCVELLRTSPLSVGEEVEVIGMGDAEDCEHDMFVEIEWDDMEFCVPLKQLVGVQVDKITKQAINNWHYWNFRGYRF